MSETDTVSPLRQRMIEDMAARKLNPRTQRSHISSYKRFAAWLKRSPDTATPDEVRRFQLHLVEGGASICNRNRIMTGVRFLFRVTLRRHDLAALRTHVVVHGCPLAFYSDRHGISASTPRTRPAATARPNSAASPGDCASS